MQALTGRGADVGAAFNIGDAANIASGAISNIASGRTAAEKAETGDKLNALSQSLGLGASASSGLAQAGRLAASEGLTRAKANQQVRLARNDAIFKGVKAGASMGIANLAGGKGFFGQDPANSVFFGGLGNTVG
jgi:transcriptional regulator with XRE-family HTH domain